MMQCRYFGTSKQRGVLINDVGGTPRRPMASNIVIQKQLTQVGKQRGPVNLRKFF